MISEDPNLTTLPQEPADISAAKAEVVVGAEGFVNPTHAHVQVPEELKGAIEAVKVPNLSGVEGTGAQQHPPAHATITGDLISLPDGFGTREAALAASTGKATDGNADAGRVFGRQDQRAKLRVQEELRRAA